MPSLKAIRRRIASVKSTQKITRAMKLVAAARLRKAQQRILDLRPYAQKTADVLASLASRTEGEGDAAHPMLRARPARAAYLVVLTSDRGLAGAYNANVQRAADRRLRELAEMGYESVKVVTLGRKGRDYFRRRGVEIAQDFPAAYEGGAKRAAEIARELVSDFGVRSQDQRLVLDEAPTVDRVDIVYTEFKSAISQRVVVDQLLPINPGGASTAAPAAASESRELATTSGRDAGASAGGAAGGGAGDFIYEPDRSALLDRLLPMYVEVAVFRAMLESSASEHGARMTAMDSATKNAKEMIASLTLQYNRARQAAITKELMEIIGGAEALKG